MTCLLARNDLPEEYVIMGLKSISKLSRQRNVALEIDLDALKNLGPKSRLEAMKQLLGLVYSYNRIKPTKLPFKNTPNREDIEKFLFPCVLKYNEEVSLIIKRYEELVANTKSKEVIL